MGYRGLEARPFIGEAEIGAALAWRPLIDTIEAAMIDFSAGRVAQPVRQMVPVPGQDGIIAAMPAVGESMAVKVVTLYHDNAGTDVPTHQAESSAIRLGRRCCHGTVQYCKCRPKPASSGANRNRFRQTGAGNAGYRFSPLALAAVVATGRVHRVGRTGAT